MSDFHFRVKASDRTEMRRALRAINVMRLVDGEFTTQRPGDAWDEIGRIEDWQNPGQWVKEPVSGEAYWHYNLRTEINVRKRIKDLVASGDPDALILDSAKGRWFAKVASGEDTSPDVLKRVWL